MARTLYLPEEIRQVLEAVGYVNGATLGAREGGTTEYGCGHRDGVQCALLAVALGLGLVATADKQEPWPFLFYDDVTKRVDGR